MDTYWQSNYKGSFLFVVVVFNKNKKKELKGLFLV